SPGQGRGGKLLARLAWDLDWGAYPDLVDSEPELLAQRPRLHPGNRWIWRAWSRLTDERGHTVSGMSVMGATRLVSRPCHIPWTAVKVWA
ncbi:hypothetical protein NL505_27795, partial [Klebsiella pneumoniae]|nr:hypothetical protein [Klebsiella pneumoniae]